MNVRVLFSYNHLIGSKIIRAGSWLFDDSGLHWPDIPSHTALLIDNQWVLESVMHGGVRVLPYSKWKSINVEVASIPVESWSEHPVQLLDEIWGRKYDGCGLLFFIYAIIVKKLLKKPMPTQNKFEADNKFFCVELVGRCLGIPNYSTITPAELLVYILKV